MFSDSLAFLVPNLLGFNQQLNQLTSGKRTLCESRAHSLLSPILSLRYAL